MSLEVTFLPAARFFVPSGAQERRPRLLAVLLQRRRGLDVLGRPLEHRPGNLISSGTSFAPPGAAEDGSAARTADTARPKAKTPTTIAAANGILLLIGSLHFNKPQQAARPVLPGRNHGNSHHFTIPNGEPPTQAAPPCSSVSSVVTT